MMAGSGAAGAGATVLRWLMVTVPRGRRDWLEAAINEAGDVPAGRSRSRWLLGAGGLMIREVLVARGAGVLAFAAHVGVAVGAVWVVGRVTDGVTYAPLRHAMVALAVVIAAVSLLAWAPSPLGPAPGDAAPGDAAARVVRGIGLVLAGLAVWGVLLEFWFNGDPTQVNPGVAERASSGVPGLTVFFGLYLAAFLVATARGSVLRGATLMASVGSAFAAAALWLGAAILMPAGSAGLAVVMMFAVGVGVALVLAARGRAPGTSAGAGLLAALLTAQLVVSGADMLFHLGPDAWIPDAGPGPLTPQDRLAQNRVEAIDPYVTVLFLGGLVAVILIVVIFAQRRRTRPPTVATDDSAAPHPSSTTWVTTVSQ